LNRSCESGPMVEAHVSPIAVPARYD
jgi:hypothetical protein